MKGIPLYKGVSGGSSEDGAGRKHIIDGGSAKVVIAAIDIRQLGKGA